tara:strand:+ start:210 stop:785 length:576 start_codon:yes stop_codon:yes gene_type:complete
MKPTGKRVYLSGVVRPDTADFIFENGIPNTTAGYMQNILVDERKGYAYKVTFAATYPNTTNQARYFNSGYGIYSFSRRELLRMTQAEGGAHLGYTRSLASLNRNIGVVAGGTARFVGWQIDNSNLQNQYVVKGDAMVTQSISIGVGGFGDEISAHPATYYIELEEYEINDNEEILLILNERAQDAQGIVDE